MNVATLPDFARRYLAAMEFIAGMEAKMTADEAKRFAGTAGYVQFQKQWKTQARGTAIALFAQRFVLQAVRPSTFCFLLMHRHYFSSIA